MTEGRGVGSSHALLVAYDRLLEGLRPHLPVPLRAPEPWLRGIPRLLRALPASVPRDLGPGGREDGLRDRLRVLRPDEELRRLARLALELGVAEPVKACGSEEELQAALARNEGGERWLADFEETKNPWFYFSYGNGLYHHHRSWIDDMSAADRDDRLLHRATRGRRGHLSPARGGRRRARTDHDRVPLVAAGGDACRPSTSGLRSARTVFPHRREPQLLHRPLVPHALLEQGARVRRAPARGTDSSPTRRTSSFCATARCARRSRSSGWTGAPAAPAPPAGPATGHRSSSGGSRSTRRCASGLHLRLSARCPRRSPSRSRSCSAESRPSACRSGSRRRTAPTKVC